MPNQRWAERFLYTSAAKHITAILHEITTGSLQLSFISWRYKHHSRWQKQIPVAAMSKASVYGRSLTGIAGSNPA
jgi:hypothetical protein